MYPNSRPDGGKSCPSAQIFKLHAHSVTVTGESIPNPAPAPQPAATTLTHRLFYILYRACSTEGVMILLNFDEICRTSPPMPAFRSFARSWMHRKPEIPAAVILHALRHRRKIHPATLQNGPTHPGIGPNWPKSVSLCRRLTHAHRLHRHHLAIDANARIGGVVPAELADFKTSLLL